MVRVREARRAFRKFHSTCFWSYRKDLEIGPADVDWGCRDAEEERRHEGVEDGGRDSWRPVIRQRSSIGLTTRHGVFLPLVLDETGGQVLHEVDLAINKVLALAGRDEARDFVDILHAHEHVLPLGAMVWAAVGKDPGFTPASLLEQLKRRGRYRPEEIARARPRRPLRSRRSKDGLAGGTLRRGRVHSRKTARRGWLCVLLSEPRLLRRPVPGTLPAGTGPGDPLRSTRGHPAEGCRRSALVSRG